MLELGPAVQAAGARRRQGPRRRRRPRERDLVALRPVAELQEEAQGLRRQEPGRLSRRAGHGRRPVAGAQARGLQVLLTATGPIPGVGVQLRRIGQDAPHLQAGPDAVRRSSCAPLGKRYPTVKLWSIWNEPNLRPWLTPQYEAGSTRPARAVIYRTLARVGDRRPARHRPPTATRSCSARRRRSATPPDPRANANPEPFLRAVFCLKANGRRLTGAAAAKLHVQRLQEAQRHRLRAPSVHARRLAPADLQAESRRDHDRRRLAADEAARPGGQARAGPEEAAGLLHRERLADQPAGPDLRRAAATTRPPT